MARRPRGDGEWSFSLRSNNYTYYDSSSDDGQEDSPQGSSNIRSAADRTQPASEEARLLGDLDLASRTDSASYKPNPWSIAKANAASRETKAKGPRKEAPRNRGAARPKVLDLLRIQNVGLNSSNVKIDPDLQAPLQTAPMMASSKPPVSSVSDDAHVASDDTLVDVCSSGPHVSSKPYDDDITLLEMPPSPIAAVHSVGQCASAPESANGPFHLENAANLRPDGTTHSSHHIEAHPKDSPSAQDFHRLADMSRAVGRDLRSMLFTSTNVRKKDGHTHEAPPTTQRLPRVVQLSRDRADLPSPGKYFERFSDCFLSLFRAYMQYPPLYFQ